MSPIFRRSRALLLLVVLAVVAIAAAAALWPDPPHPAPPQPRQVLIDVADGPDQQERAQLDATLYSAAETPAPAVVIAHGMGGDKGDSAAQARDLAARGFTVLTYSARGFGASSGRIGLNSPDYEVADARQILDWLARQPEVLRDRDGDPRVGVTGESYGGALSLLLAGSDPRVDAIAPVMTYHDLAQALLPNSAAPEPFSAATPAASPSAPEGVFKRAWAGRLFATGTAPPAGGSSGAPATCGRFRPDVCAAYSEIARTGRASQPTLDLLARVSPSSVTGRIRVPTLLAQGEQDSLFGLDQAEANARDIAAAGGKVKLLWFAGGHDGAAPGAQVHRRVADWFAFHLGLPGAPDPGTGFEYEVAGTPGRDGEAPVRTVSAPAYPGIGAPRTPRFALPLRGAPAAVVNPPGGSPASTSTLPGRPAGSAEPVDLPGQTATFRTEPVRTRTVISGTPRTALSVASVPGQPANGEAVLFAKLYDVDAEGHRSLLGGAAPMHLSGLRPDGTPQQVHVALPGVVHSLEPGHRLELAVTTTDEGYATMTEPVVHRIALAGAQAVSVPSVKGTSAAAGTVPVGPLLGIGGIAVLVLLAWLFSRLRGHPAAEPDPELADVPLAVEDLHKRYSRKIVALEGLSMRVERGQVVGLLGPNGAGKTTALRTLLGLLSADSGRVRVFGHVVEPGAPVLSRVGSLVDSPGFLPHLSGLDNLRYHWAATGRPMLQARFDEVLRMTGLDEHADRRTGTYSQGLRQRLGIAQAMLGLPDLLVLDEPLNGLDPPQIHRLREILRRYAASGRSVLVASHLLSEVEQSCTHVVVLHHGRVVNAGPVEQVIARGGEATFQVDDPDRAIEALRSLEGVGEVGSEDGRVHADLAGHSRAIAVNVLVAAGVEVHRVGPRRRLEDAFLDLVGEERA